MRTHWMRQLLALILLCCALVPAYLAAQEDPDAEIFVPVYSLGDQTLEINLGTLIPLFYLGGPDGIAATNLSLGGLGSFAWSSYITNTFKLGVEVGGTFLLTPNSTPLFQFSTEPNRILYVVPIAATATYVFSAYPFEFPVSVALGTSISRLEDLTKVDPFAKAGGSFFWNFSSQWAFGANLKYWFIPQIYTASTPAGSDATRFGNFLEFSLSALYHF